MATPEEKAWYRSINDARQHTIIKRALTREAPELVSELKKYLKSFGATSSSPRESRNTSRNRRHVTESRDEGFDNLPSVEEFVADFKGEDGDNPEEAGGLYEEILDVIGDIQRITKNSNYSDGKIEFVFNVKLPMPRKEYPSEFANYMQEVSIPAQAEAFQNEVAEILPGIEAGFEGRSMGHYHIKAFLNVEGNSATIYDLRDSLRTLKGIRRVAKMIKSWLSGYHNFLQSEYEVWSEGRDEGDGEVEEAVDDVKKMYDKGYRFKIEFDKNDKIEPVYTKTQQQASELMKDQYKDRKNSKISPIGQTESVSLKDTFSGSLNGSIREEEDIDDAAVTELVISSDSDSDLYRQSFVPIVKNLMKKIRNGTYDHELSKKLWMYHAEAAAKRYCKEFCGEGDKWFEIFPMNVRKAAAAQWADSFKVEADLGNYDTPTFK